MIHLWTLPCRGRVFDWLAKDQSFHLTNIFCLFFIIGVR